MKVLIISDNNEDVEFVDSFMKERGYDVIVYQWLIKAMDNLEEIKPDIVIVNSKEYPRRWKTLASFLQSGIGGEKVKLYLYDPEPLTSDEEEKAKALGIEGSIPALDSETMDRYFPLESDVQLDIQDMELELNEEQEETTEEESKEEDENALIGEFKPKPVLTSQIILTNPNNGSLLSGRIISFSEDSFECKIASDDLENGQLIKYISIYYDDKVSYLSADITENNKEKGTLSLTVCEYYEEF